MSKYKIINSAGITAAIGLASLPAFLTLAPIFKPAAANAEPKTLGAAATVVPNLSLAAESVTMAITPSAAPVFKTGSVTATVSTNNETGYTLYFSDKDENTSLSHTNLSNASITSTASTLSGNAMDENTWGYTLDDTVDEAEDEVNNTTNRALNYSPIPTDYTAINSTNAQTSGDVSKLSFGVKIDNSIPSGTYSDEILISAVINYSSAGYDQSRLWLNKNGVQISTMQEMTYDICESVPTPTVTATGSNVPEIELTDTRNNEKYTVRKLADGNCWMTENLALDNRTGTNRLTPADSNVTEDFNLPVATASTGTSNTSTEAKIANDGTNGAYLYNWYAATAGTGKDTMYSTDTITVSASGDICPKGWQLPNNSGNMSWNKLFRVGQGVYEIATTSNTYANATVAWGSYDGIKLATANPLGLQATGVLWDRKILDAGGGYYQTRTAGSSRNEAYNLTYNINTVTLQSNNNKGGGRAIRCVAKGINGVTPAAATYMQDVETCPASLPTGTQYTLKDKRDEKEYTVARLADGNCWMTSNLAIEGGTELTPSTSDVSSSYTIPTTGNYYMHTAHGGYYPWTTAVAGSAVSSGSNSTVSICPRGWKLPTSAQLSTIISNYNEKIGPNTAFNIQLGGYYYASPAGVGGSGYLWSSTLNHSTFAYHLAFNDTVSVSNSGSVNYGFNVRCILR